MDSTFPFKTTLTLDSIISFWEEQQKNPNPILAANARKLVQEAKKHPELQGEIADMSVLEKHKQIVESLMSALLPPAADDDVIHAAFKPFSMDYFYGSKKFHEIIDRAGCIGNMVDESIHEEMSRNKLISAYQYILARFYQVDSPKLRHFLLSMKEENGLTRYYQLSLNPRFCDIRAKGKLPDFSEEKLQEVVDHISDPDYLMAQLPPDLFEFVGFGIYTMTEDTGEVVISQIKEVLLKKDSITLEPGFEFLEKNFSSLLENPEIKLGITIYQKRKKSFYKIKNKGGHSLMTDQEGNYLEPFFNVNQKLLATREPYIVKDLREDPIFSSYASQIQNNLKSIVFTPLLIGDELVGVLEVGSPRPGAFSAFTLARLNEVIPLFAVAVKRNSEELDNRIQSIIKEHYTSIHPTVEWKFTDAAYKILDQEEKGEKPEPEEIVFNNIYPLYAASDIRNSSIIRNEAIIGDLTTQLKAAKKVLEKTAGEEEFPLLGELIFKINRSVSNLKKGLLSGDESSILRFIREELEPVILSLENEKEDFKTISRLYWDQLDPLLKVVYDKRKAFEESLTTLNETISSFLDQEQEKAQKVFPHFFEKYKTDGIEYNAYIGGSITQRKKFSKLHLKNLRLWQLLATIEIARRTNALKDKLPVPLETTHLVLVHSQPLSVRFRMDEKQFDVDGAYNMRYEIVKKRIDKIKIRDTQERLTQPGKVAVVFSDNSDAKEYIQYFEYLQFKGMVHPEIERIELEELQGVNGLQALRVRVESGGVSFLDELENLKRSTLV